MHKAVITQIKKRLQALDKQSSFFTKIQASKSFQTNPITKDNFHAIVPSTKDFLAIDGGQNILFASSSLLISIIRVTNTKQTYTVIVMVQSTVEHIQVDVIPFDEESETFLETCKLPDAISHTDADLFRQGSIELSTVARLYRRLLERNLVAQTKGALWDGSLEEHHAFEKNIQIDAIGVSKTSKLLTAEQVPIQLVLSRLAPDDVDVWYVSDIMVAENFQTCFVKLHPRSKFIFRVDIPNALHPQEVCGQLLGWCKDPAFFGYPYPLIKADEMARISEEEIEYIKNRFFASFDELTREMLEQMRTTQSAHSILDTMKF